MSSAVAIYAPDGTLGSVPYEQMQAALKAGGKIAQHMTAPDGTPGYVPADRVQDALKAGGKIVPTGGASDASIPENYGFTLGNMASQAKKGISELASGVAGLGKTVFDPTIPVVGGTHMEGGNVAIDPNSMLGKATAGLPEQEAKAKQLWQQGHGVQAAGHELASYLPLAGPWAAGLGEQAGTGDVGGATARGGAQLAAGALAKPILNAAGTGVGMAREAVGKSIHTPEGELTPGAELAGKVAGGAAGAAAGSAIGHEYIGAMAGYKLGPSLMDRLFPEPADQVSARANFKNTQQIAEAQEAAIKEDAQRTNAQRIATNRAVAAEQASRDQLWQARDSMAQDLMRRQAVQDKLDAADVRAANAAARAKRQMQEDIDNGYIQKGQDLMNRQKQQDALDQEASRAAKEAQDARDQHAQDLMNRQKQQDALDAQHAKALAALEQARQAELAQGERFRNQHAQSLNARPDIPQGNPTPFGPLASPSSPRQ